MKNVLLTIGYQTPLIAWCPGSWRISATGAVADNVGFVIFRLFELSKSAQCFITSKATHILQSLQLNVVYGPFVNSPLMHSILLESESGKHIYIYIQGFAWQRITAIFIHCLYITCWLTRSFYGSLLYYVQVYSFLFTRYTFMWAMSLRAFIVLHNQRAPLRNAGARFILRLLRNVFLRKHTQVSRASFYTLLSRRVYDNPRGSIAI